MTACCGFGTDGSGETASAVRTWWVSLDGSHVFEMKMKTKMKMMRGRVERWSEVNISVYLYTRQKN